MPIRAEHDRTDDRRSLRGLLLLVAFLPVAFVALTVVRPLSWQWDGEEWRLGGSAKGPLTPGIYHVGGEALRGWSWPPPDDASDLWWEDEWGFSIGFRSYGLQRGRRHLYWR
jgi:hypothetical protein